MGSGDNLIKAIKTRTVTKEYLTYTENDFHGGYEEHYLYKFKQFQSSVGRHLQNLRLKDMYYELIKC